MILDGHVHIGNGAKDPSLFMQRLAEAGMIGSVVISLPPPAFPAIAQPMPARKRLDDLMAFTEHYDKLYPLFWIDPMESDAVEQASEAAAQGVTGFKVICHNYLLRFLGIMVY